MEVNGKPVELIENTNHGQDSKPGISPRKWEMRREGVTVGVIFDRDVAKALGARV